MKLSVAHIFTALVSITTATAKGEENLLRHRKDVHGHKAPFTDVFEVLQENVDEEDRTFWNRMLQDASFSMSMNMNYDSCFGLTDDPTFHVEDTVNIFDGKDIDDAGSCGEHCYSLSADPNDTFAFAYQSVSSDNFSFRSRVCSNECFANYENYCGDIGLMIRESLDPSAKFVYLSFTPALHTTLSARTEADADVFYSFFGSRDEQPCYWLTITRDGDKFTVDWAEEKSDRSCSPCEEDGFGCTTYFGAEEFNQPLTDIGMPTDVLVGLAILDSEGSFERTETPAVFRDIELTLE